MTTSRRQWVACRVVAICAVHLVATVGVVDAVVKVRRRRSRRRHRMRQRGRRMLEEDQVGREAIVVVEEAGIGVTILMHAAAGRHRLRRVSLGMVCCLTRASAFMAGDVMVREGKADEPQSD